MMGMSNITKVLLFGTIIRAVILILYPGWVESLKHSVQLVSPVTNFISLKEGVYMLKNNIPPYEGGILRQSPLLLPIYSYLSKLNYASLYIVYIIMDITITLLFYKIGALYLKQIYQYGSISKSGKFEIKSLKFQPWLLSAFYYLNPLSILSCFSLSSSIFYVAFVLSALLFAVKNNIFIANFFLALATMLQLYPITLLVPIHLFVCKQSRYFDSSKIFTTVSSYLFWMIIFNYLSFNIVGSFDYISASFGTIFYVKDLTPNLGLFWYFFIEMFLQFRTYFVLGFQFFNFALLVPIAYRFNDHPMLVFFLQLATNSILKSHPTLSDLAFYLPFICFFQPILKYLKSVTVVTIILIVSICLSPILWEGWINIGTANANFFYGVTMAYFFAQRSLIADLLQAYRKFDLFNRHPNLANKKLVFE